MAEYGKIRKNMAEYPLTSLVFLFHRLSLARYIMIAIFPKC